ncbi:MAG: diversity-generating retroelement protein Avd [Anaerolineaceae bacterium]|nr:diversity-generating retroelement protein Avd [Anaerolineaceae bacterium]
MAQSPIFARTENFIVWMLQHTAKFPRQERFRLAKRIDDSLFDFHLHLVDAARNDSTCEHLRTADRSLFLLRTYLRLSWELKYTSNDQFHYCAEKLDEIGKLLGGWIKKSCPSERSG